jgi:hypothetical protein
MSFENDLHDWYIDGVMMGPSEVTLFVHFYEARKEIRFSGVTRCLLDNWFVQNIIYEAKVISADKEPELYRAEIAPLDAKYPARFSAADHKILLISASVGVEEIIEFRDFQVIDL